VTAVPLSAGDLLPDVTMTPTPLQLFRYSAVTWNSHRIHFDRDWAAHEGHEGLLVHSHLHAANVLRALTEGLGTDWQIAKVAYRIVRPAAVGTALTATAEITGVRDDGQTMDLALREVDPSGAACLEGTATVVRRKAGA
jgi:3-methylfumaryl-CoA hydratase